MAAKANEHTSTTRPRRGRKSKRPSKKDSCRYRKYANKNGCSCRYSKYANKNGCNRKKTTRRPRQPPPTTTTTTTTERPQYGGHYSGSFGGNYRGKIMVSIIYITLNTLDLFSGSNYLRTYSISQKVQIVKEIERMHILNSKKNHLRLFSLLKKETIFCCYCCVIIPSYFSISLTESLVSSGGGGGGKKRRNFAAKKPTDDLYDFRNHINKAFSTYLT